MRTVRLARVAAQAELLLVRRIATSIVRRALYGAVAAVFALSFLALLHVLIALALIQYAGLSPVAAVAIVAVLDLIMVGVFGMLAVGKVNDPVILEARRVRDQSIEQARASLTLAAMIAPAARMIAQTGVLRVLFRALGVVARRPR